jgi:hypothetical protein
MKPKRYKKWLVLAFALANGLGVVAQSNSVPGAMDYPSFSRFITERNIFDPSRFARSSPDRPAYHPQAARSAPTFTLVGTINYQKGMFAFFDGNTSDLRKVLTKSGDIAGYTVTEITLAGVKLETADKKEMVEMKPGEAMRQEEGHWLPAGRSEVAADTNSPENVVPEADAAPAPSSAGEPNDILKKLMQQREKELK